MGLISTQQSQTSAAQRHQFSQSLLLPLSRQSRNHGADLWRHPTTATTHGKRAYLSKKNIEADMKPPGMSGPSWLWRKNIWMLSLSNIQTNCKCWWLKGWFLITFFRNVSCMEVLKITSKERTTSRIMSATIGLILNGQNYAWKNVLIWKGEVEGGNHRNKKDMIFPISST